jgi:hypothetical protein
VELVIGRISTHGAAQFGFLAWAFSEQSPDQDRLSAAVMDDPSMLGRFLANQLRSTRPVPAPARMRQRDKPRAEIDALVLSFGRIIGMGHSTLTTFGRLRRLRGERHGVPLPQGSRAMFSQIRFHALYAGAARVAPSRK